MRFRVEDGSLLGQSWTLRGTKTTPDVYVINRAGGKWLHTSFHASGEQHFAVTTEGIARMRQGGEKYMAVSMGREMATGWRRSHRIVVARSDLRPDLGPTESKKITPVPLAPDDQAVAIELWLQAPGAPILQIEAHPIAHMGRGGGGSAFLISRPLALDAPLHELYAADIGIARRHLMRSGWDGEESVRFTIFMDWPEGGALQQIEVTLDPVDAAPDEAASRLNPGC